MSAGQKPRGGGNSEMTRFKKLWCDSFSKKQRKFLRTLFICETMTQAQIREEIRRRFGIEFTSDSQLNRFRDWEWEQRQIEQELEKMRADQERFENEHPEWTKDQLREKVIAMCYRRARSTGDFQFGVRIASVDNRWAKIYFEQEKLQESIRLREAQFQKQNPEPPPGQPPLDRFAAIMEKALGSDASKPNEMPPPKSNPANPDTEQRC
jgi:hypothetical protein